MLLFRSFVNHQYLKRNIREKIDILRKINTGGKVVSPPQFRDLSVKISSKLNYNINPAKGILLP